MILAVLIFLLTPICLAAEKGEKLGEQDKALEYYRKAFLASAHNPPAADAVPFARKKLS